ncbi:hypothetical protein BKA57DRAFT_88515 [Linnemannia elongata]|nr:hypothetical protein BKA57DRAFT_88515 [Linnemannia elongata]
MIRRSAYQEVVVVVHAAGHPSLPLPSAPSPSPSSCFSAPPDYTQHAQQTQPQAQQQQQQYSLSSVRPWDNTNTSTEHKNNESNTFKVPIHLIKRSRAVLFKDLERLITPSSTAGCGSSGRLVQAIRTQHGDTIYSRNGHDPDVHESSNNNNIAVNNQNFTDSRTNSCSKNFNKHDNSIVADLFDAAAGAARSSHRPSDSSLHPAPFTLPSSTSFSRINNTITPTSTTPPSSSSSPSTFVSHKPQQQQQPTFIPIHEDMEGCVWYLYPSSSPSLSFSSDRSSSTNNHPFMTSTTTTPIMNGKDEHWLVGPVGTTNRSQTCSSSSSFASASTSSPFSVVEDSKKELFWLLDTSMAGITAAATSPILQGGEQATLLRGRQQQEQQEEQQEIYRQERGEGERRLSPATTTAMQGFDHNDGCSRTLFQRLDYADPPDDADKEGHAAEEGVERRGGGGGEVDESQTRRTKLGGRITEGQSSPFAESRSRSERGSATQTKSIYPSSSMTTRTSTCQTLFATTPNIDRQRQQRLQQEEEMENEQRQLYDKRKESNSSLSLSPQHYSHFYSDNHRFEQTTFAPRPSSSLDDSSFSFSLSLSSFPTSSFLPSSSSSSSLSSSSSSCTPTSTQPPHQLPATSSSSPSSSLSSSTQLPLSLSSRSAPTLSSPTQTTKAFNQTNSTNTASIPPISGTFTTNPKMMIMTPPTSAHTHTHTHAHSQESSRQRQQRPAAVVACSVECWTTMIQLQEQLEQLAQSLVSVLDSNEVDRRKTSELRAMAMAALETCAGISSSSSASSSTATTTTMTTLTPRSSQHSTKDSTDHDDNGINGGNNGYGLLTPEATPVSTPVITATIHNHHQQQPVSPRGSLHSVSSTSSSRTFKCSSGGGGSDQRGRSGSGGITGLSALTLPGTIVSDLEEQEQRQLQEWNKTRNGGDNGSNDPQLLQGTISHFSSYRTSFPPVLSNSSTPSSSATAANPHNNTSTSTSTASSPATRTIHASQTMPSSTTATTTPTATTMRPSSGKKSRNPFLAMFGRTPSSTTPLPSPSSSPLQGPISLGGVTQVYSQHPSSPKAHKSSGSSNGSRSGRKKEGMKKSGDEGISGGEKKKRRSSWFKSATTATAATTTEAASTTIQRGRANTMHAVLPSSSSSGSHLNNHRGSSSSSSSANAVTASGPESSASRVTTASAQEGSLMARRFSTPFQFSLRGPGSRRSTLSTANSTSTSTSRAPPPPSSSLSSSSSSSGQISPSTSSFPRQPHRQPVGPQSRPQYYYYSAAAGNPQQLGPSTRTATGSFFDSVSDDDSDSDEDPPSQYQQRQQYQYQSQQAPPPNYHQQQRVQPQQQQSAAVSSRQDEQDRRYRSYDSDDDSDTSEEEEDSESNSDEDSDEEDSDEDEEETNSSYRHRHQQQVVNPDTLEGYTHLFDDAPPPPSYHSLIRAEADAARSAALATLSARGRQQQQQQQPHAHAHVHIHADARSSPAAYPHTSAIMPSTLLTGLYASSSFITTPTAQTSTPPAPSSSQVSPTVLANLLTLLHTFETHLLTQYKTPSFQAQQSTAAGTMSRRQAWLDRNPQTVASFAYLLIELQQTGILPTAMSPSWSSSSISPSSSPSSPSSSLSLALEMSEQDWLSVTGNAATEADLAKALLALEQNCLLAMDPVHWHQEGEERREAWTRQVQAIITSSSN